jgi:threonine dehydrogenase-like Zn-dependent dehydrogenase
MKIVQIKGPKLIKTSEAKEERAEGEVKIKLSKVALSRTDLNLYMGADEHVYPIIPAHSAIGFVSEADEASGLKLGSRVAISPYIDFSEFNFESLRAKRIEVMGISRDGLLRDFVNIPVDNVYQLPEGINDEEALFLDYISFGTNVFENYDFEKGDYVAIIGSGIFQLILGQLAIYYQIVPILIDQSAEKLNDAKNFGIYYTVDASSENVVERVKEITGGRFAEFTVFLPKETPFEIAENITMQGGTIIVAGYDRVSDKHIVNMKRVLSKQLKIIGVNNGFGETASAINLLANKIIKTDRMISREIDFENVSQIFKEWAKDPSKYRKIIVNI